MQLLYSTHCKFLVSIYDVCTIALNNIAPVFFVPIETDCCLVSIFLNAQFLSIYFEYHMTKV